ncbi:MAG: response regulator [Candidatus Competibacteraceae bacterium]
MNITELKGTTVFVVDDNINNLNVVADHLTPFGLKVIPFKSGEAALAVVEKRLPDIILLDVMMPDGIDGFETCRRLKTNPQTHNIPVIFISAASETVNKVTGFNLGGVDYIAKPFELEELLSRVYVHTIHRLQRNLVKASRSSKKRYWPEPRHSEKPTRRCSWKSPSENRPKPDYA